MIEKVNPKHPDKIADRIAGALVDIAYTLNKNPKIAVEVLIGHGVCTIITETSERLPIDQVYKAVRRIAGQNIDVNYTEVKQDEHLANNQRDKIRCGDNGIFKGMPLTDEQKELSKLARYIYSKHPYDGKYILTDKNFIVCQSNVDSFMLWEEIHSQFDIFNRVKGIINPLGDWVGGTDVDTGATNRKLGSDMADSVTGGGLHGKDLSKADVSVNIFAFKMAQEIGKPVELYCAIGDEYVNGKPYFEIVEEARNYIRELGGFEKFAEWGLF